MNVDVETNVDVDLTPPASLVPHSANDEMILQSEEPEAPPFAPYGHGGTSIRATGRSLQKCHATFPSINDH
jgi:hypothetical protein